MNGRCGDDVDDSLVSTQRSDNRGLVTLVLYDRGYGYQ